MASWQFPTLGHGGDYNPDQWRHIPGTFEKDLELMRASHCNLMSVGIFSWAALEPEEGRYDTDWLQAVLDGLHANNISVLLATPSGARPAWMSRTYPEVLRVKEDGLRNLHGGRHNHCYTSPVYRAQVTRINTMLAERFGTHPAVVGWHISNEYNGACYCELCQAEFRRWLRAKYGTLEALNHAWWTGFWAKTYTDWAQLEAPAAHGEGAVHGLRLDWLRFITDRTVDFMRHEIQPLRRLTPHLPVTTNMMGTYEGLDYPRFADAGILDVASWDSYPLWGRDADDLSIAHDAGFAHDITRSLLRKPFLLMESTPSMTNWQPFAKLKRPGMHLLSSLQAVAHGADTVQYFQWRKSRGSSEKLHGAVVDHVGHANTRVFRDVTQVGEALEKLAPVAGSHTPAQAAVIFDWNNRWAIKGAQGPAHDKRHDEIVRDHYRALRSQGVDVDVIDMQQDFTPYKLIIAPMLYMVKPGVAERLEAFVRAGGQLVVTYWSGVTDENDLCFLGGFPGPLRKVLGVWCEEIDALYPGQSNRVVLATDNETNLAGEYACDFLCELAHAETARTLATYGEDFYAGYPALTVNDFGEGNAWYIAAHTGVDFLSALYGKLVGRAGIEQPLGQGTLPEGLLVSTRRTLAGESFVFVMNFGTEARQITLPCAMRDMLAGGMVEGGMTVAPTGLLVLQKQR